MKKNKLKLKSLTMSSAERLLLSKWRNGQGKGNCMLGPWVQVCYFPQNWSCKLGSNHTSNIAIGLGKLIYIVGTNSNFDFGSYVFDQTMKHATSYAVKMPIAFPSLIWGLILSQHPSILINSDNTYKRDPPFLFHYRLFTGKHVPDIVMTSGQTPSRATNRTYILVELKDTCKTLDETIKSYTERKNKIEMLIKALPEEEWGLKGVEINEEEENEDGFYASDDEDTTSSDEDWRSLVILYVGYSYVSFVGCALDNFLCTLKCSWLWLFCKLSWLCFANIVVLVCVVFINFMAKNGE